uniref:Platelet inhibitor triplatin-2 n=1 Tax=Triatoma infestans TaxID=30076 RepID=TRIP2_TRIIF|nr:RecName: Full=Platelet inhibitor triplatin-2; Short=Tripla-2; Flags: Precursor [Triatoma infestans]BAE96122.1 platelet inhibitor triplatin-2 [Triatoma infestans]
MKMIISLTFLGILMLAFAEVNSETCTLMEAAKNFDENKYFNIPLAYATHSKNREPETNVCREYSTARGPDGKTVTTFTIKDKTLTSAVKCTNTPIPGSNGQFSSDCELSAGNRITVTTSILATDNEKYAILQRCPTSGPGNILVLQTNKNGVEQGVQNYFNQKGWDISTWLSRTTVGC